MTDADITELLRDLDLSGGAAADVLFERLYETLRGIAARRIASERSGHTLSATALVHEAYLKLARLDDFQWKNRQQFFAVAARAMRRILVNHARDRRAHKRSGDVEHVTLEAGMADEPADQPLHWDELLATDAALTELHALHGRQGRVAEMRLFGGLTHDEVAEALGVSVPTVERDWRLGRAFLAQALDRSDD